MPLIMHRDLTEIILLKANLSPSWSASIGMLGGARAQYHLRQAFVFLNMYSINRPEVIVTFAPEKIDENGNLKDEMTKKFIKELLENLIAWTKKIKT